MRNKPFLLLLKIYLILMSFLTACRVYLIVVSWSDIDPNSFSLLPETIIRGMLFDTVFINISFFLPSVLLSVFYLLKTYPKFFTTGLRYYLNIASILVLAGGFTDIGYYNYYGTRLTVGVFSWIDTPDLMATEVFSNPSYLILIALGILLQFFFNKYLKKNITEHLGQRYFSTSPLSLILQFIIVGFFLFLGARGSLNFDERPKNISDSLFSKHPLLNNITLNGLFNLIHSSPKDNLDLFNSELAQASCQTFFKTKGTKNSPIAREVIPTGKPKKKNVIFIIMESMTGYQISSYGKSKGYVPFFESLTEKSIFYPNLYTAGIHTHNGIYASLWGQPALLNQKPMVEATKTRQQFYGLPHILKEKGYETFFFSPGDPRFDNMRSFISSNGFDHFSSQEDFDESKRNSKWGIPDHILFNENIKPLDDAYKNNQPFFATYLTISTHSPYTIPKGIAFKPREGTTDKRDIAYEYADWSLKQFFNTIENKPWFKETVFALVADHGQIFERYFQIPLTYHHCPFIIYDPELNPIKKDTKMAMQIDVFPTLLGYLNMPYTNNTFGINLLQESRPYSYFTADTKIGIIDSTHFYINNLDGVTQLFKYKDITFVNEAESEKEKVHAMKNFALSQLQLSFDMIKNDQVKKPE